MSNLLFLTKSLHTSTEHTGNNTVSELGRLIAKDIIQGLFGICHIL